MYGSWNCIECKVVAVTGGEMNRYDFAIDKDQSTRHFTDKVLVFGLIGTPSSIFQLFILQLGDGKLIS